MITKTCNICFAVVELKYPLFVKVAVKSNSLLTFNTFVKVITSSSYGFCEAVFSLNTKQLAPLVSLSFWQSVIRCLRFQCLCYLKLRKPLCSVQRV